ncbi:MAG: Holliday junction branch migration protein RuvA [Candidatus Methanoperedens sp.]|nr:Holliday junction branch migration protein RuvA [Candidatus Methanoperedens sp.]
MISHITGEIAQSGDGYVVIDVAGIGYQVFVPKSISYDLAGKKEIIKLHTYLHVREDALILYGFQDQSQLEMFKLLISVTRVGPAVAINILSQIKIEELAAAIIHDDEKVLTRISGVGAKNAKRLILELKDKMKKKMEGVVLPPGSDNYDAVSALVSLGFPRQDAQRAVEAVSINGGSVEALIKAALMKMRE